jgi:FkbM family methyltransferase
VSLTQTIARVPSTTFLGRIVRRLFRLVPHRAVETIRRGPLKGRRWIVASGVNGYWLGTYEPEMQRAVERVVARGGVFYDIGAHAGYFSLLASQAVGPDGRVVAFEPDAGNLGHLREHVRLNGAGNVTVMDAAVADASGSARFAAPSSSFEGSLSRVGGVDVNTVTIDGLVESGTLPAPTYVKIDVEGAEFRVLCGARRTLQTAAPTLFLAVHSPAAERLCLDALAMLRYEVRPVTRGTWLCVPTPHSAG